MWVGHFLALQNSIDPPWVQLLTRDQNEATVQLNRGLCCACCFYVAAFSNLVVVCCCRFQPGYRVSLTFYIAHAQVQPPDS